MNAAQDCYPSRVGKKEEILERLDPVVYDYEEPTSPYALNRNQLAQFERDGFITLPDFLPEMVEPLVTEIGKMKQQMAGREELVTEPDSHELRSIFALHQHSDLMDRFSRDRRILDIVNQLLGSDVYLMQSRLNIKPAFKGKSFSWHSDFETWHVEDGMPRMRAVTVWLMLDENNEFNGPLYVVPGSHKKYVSCQGTTELNNHQKSLKKQVAGVPEPESINQILKDNGLVSIKGKPGTLVIHECNLLHGSPDNISPWTRSVLMFVYNSVENKVIEPYSNLKPRPEYLSSSDQSPLKPVDNN
jgi:ectoine hydroxylase